MGYICVAREHITLTYSMDYSNWEWMAFRNFCKCKQTEIAKNDIQKSVAAKLTDICALYFEHGYTQA